jgi:transposase
VGSYTETALASRVANYQLLVAQQTRCILATNQLDDTQLLAQRLVAGDKGQVHAECGCRSLKDPCYLAALLYLKKPERNMALLMVMMVCLLVYLALEYRLCTAPKGSSRPLKDFITEY